MLLSQAPSSESKPASLSESLDESESLLDELSGKKLNDLLAHMCFYMYFEIASTVFVLIIMQCAYEMKMPIAASSQFLRQA